MRTIVYVNKFNIFLSIILLIGICNFISGIFYVYKEKTSVKLDELVEGKYSKGVYVTGDIDLYLTVKDVNPENEDSLGVSQTLETSGNTYEFFTVPTKNDMYIRIMVSSKKMLRSLKSMEDDDRKNIYFEGMLVRSPLEINYDWYEQANISTNSIIVDYVVKEIDIKNKVRNIYIGSFLLAYFFIQFKLRGGIKSIVTEEKSSKRY